MTARMFAATLAAVVGIGSMLAPVESSARPVGASGRTASFHGAFRAPVVRSPGRTVVPAVSKAAAARMHGLSPRLHRRAAGFGLTGWWGGYGTYYDPSNYVMLHDARPRSDLVSDEPVSGPSAVTVRVIPPVYGYSPGCQSQTQNVATSAGGERPITIVRC